MNHPVLGEIECVRSARARRISISVRKGGAVRLVYPRRVSQREAWAFLESKVAWVERARQRLAARTPVEPLLPPAEAKERIEELRRAAKADLPARLERLSQQTGLQYAGLTIRAARTKWGCCTCRNTLSLSLFLMLLPEHLRDFVLLHELCHTVHYDHSPRFHALLDRLTGGREKELRRELRGYSIRG